jgi:superfamily II DNA or RNA helicase
MNDIEIQPVDSVHIKVNCERSIAKELSQFFTFTVPNYKYVPAYRNKIWDGQIRLYNVHTRTIYAGLVDYVLKFAYDRGYSISNPIKNKNNIIPEMVAKYVYEKIMPSSDGKGIELYEHQLDAISYAINNGRCLLLSPTGSGKSLIIYCLIRYYESILPKDKKILVVVPTTGLVAQMYNDFKDYSSKVKWSADNNCHSIYAGQDKVTEKRIVISTWQSIYKMPDKYFKQFGAVFGDECHLFKAKSLTTLMTKLVDCPYRIGTTGTLDGSFTHKLVIEGLFGKVYNVTTTKKLMEKELLSDLEIECITLLYSKNDIQNVKRVTYQEELKWIVENDKRNEFLSKLCSTLHGNTLMLFNFVETHGKPLYEMIKKGCSDKRKVFFIYGGTDTQQREKIRQVIDKEKNAILIASYGTCSTGINIKNIHNIIFASPSKSVIRVLQSIGRGLRKSKTKNKVKLYDISDNLCHKKYKNHTMRHLDERRRIYSNEKFNWKSVKIQL